MLAQMILDALAALCFILATFGLPAPPAARWPNLLGLGLFFLALAQLLAAFK